MKYKMLKAQSKQTFAMQKYVKANVYLENTHILIIGNNLKPVGRECTSGNPWRHHRGVHTLGGRLLD